MKSGTTTLTTVTEASGTAEFTPSVTDLKTAVPVDSTFLAAIAGASLSGEIQIASPTLTHDLPNIPGTQSHDMVAGNGHTHYEYRLVQ